MNNCVFNVNNYFLKIFIKKTNKLLTYTKNNFLSILSIKNYLPTFTQVPTTTKKIFKFFNIYIYYIED